MARLFNNAEPKCVLVARDYQATDANESFRLYEQGVRGVLTRIFTGGGKTPCACLKIRRWLQGGPRRRVMVISYEQQLVWQFAQEIEGFLGITPAVEMGDDEVSPGEVPPPGGSG